MTMLSALANISTYSCKMPSHSCSKQTGYAGMHYPMQLCISGTMQGQPHPDFTQCIII